MTDTLRLAEQAMGSDRVREIAKILAEYHLGICIPHMHDEQTGELVTLPPGVVSCERNLSVSFEAEAISQAQEMRAVAWRWDGAKLEVCASCCTITT